MYIMYTIHETHEVLLEINNYIYIYILYLYISVTFLITNLDIIPYTIMKVLNRLSICSNVSYYYK